jgi:hypothetical protein
MFVMFIVILVWTSVTGPGDGRKLHGLSVGQIGQRINDGVGEDVNSRDDEDGVGEGDVGEGDVGEDDVGDSDEDGEDDEGVEDDEEGEDGEEGVGEYDEEGVDEVSKFV